MDILLAVDILDEYVAKDRTGCVIEAWRPLRTKVLAQQTNNTGSHEIAFLESLLKVLSTSSGIDPVLFINDRIAQLRASA